MQRRRWVVLTVTGMVILSSLLAVFAWERLSESPSGNLNTGLSIASAPWVGNSSTAHSRFGVAYTFSAVVSGGDPPYSANWIFGDGTKGWGLSLTHLYPSPGANCFNGSLAVTDSSGGQSTAYFTLNAQTGAMATSSGGNSAGTTPSHFSVC
jgi:PKD domain